MRLLTTKTVFKRSEQNHMNAKNIRNIAVLLFVTAAVFVTWKSVDASVPGWTITGSGKVMGLRESINLAWVLLSAFLVFNMQVGFAFLGAGFLKKQNTLNYIAMSFVDFCVGGFVFWIVGFGLMFGGSHLGSGLEKRETL